MLSSQAELPSPQTGGDEDTDMVAEAESPGSKPRRKNRLEVWFFVAVSLVGLLGFMAILSTGDVEGMAGGKALRTAGHAPRNLEELQ